MASLITVLAQSRVVTLVVAVLAGCAALLVGGADAEAEVVFRSSR